MSSPEKVQPRDKGKRREVLAEDSRSGPSGQVHHDVQGSHAGGDVSPLELSTLSTTPPLEMANKSINKWLSNTEAPSGSGNSLIQNQENIQQSRDPGSAALEEFKEELNALTKRPFNMKGKLGTCAPANTPLSCESNGVRARALSTGDAHGKRTYRGTQARTMEDSNMPRPLFSTSNSGKVTGTSSSLPDVRQSSTSPEIQPFTPELPNKSAMRSSQRHAAVKTNSGAEKSSSTSSTAAEQSTSQADLTTKSLTPSKPLLVRQRGVFPGMVQYLRDKAAERPSVLSGSGRSITAPTLRGSTVNTFGLAQPPTSQSFQQDDPHNLRPLSLRPTTSHGDPANEVEFSSQVQGFSGIGRQHSPQASAVPVLRSTRPASRRERIVQDINQLLRDCFCRSPVTDPQPSDTVDHEINEHSTSPVNENRDGSNIGDVFERTGDATDLPYLPTLDSFLRTDPTSVLDAQPGLDAPPAREERTLSNESSNTALDSSIKSDRPANDGASDRPENDGISERPANDGTRFQRWRAKIVAAVLCSHQQA